MKNNLLDELIKQSEKTEPEKKKKTEQEEVDEILEKALEKFNEDMWTYY